MKHDSLQTKMWLPLGATLMQGCMGGVVLDAESSDGVADAKITAVAVCHGAGCEDGIVHEQTTDSFGAYVYDAYGDIHGEESIQRLQPASGNLTIPLRIEKDGYETRWVFHQPDYETQVDPETGEERLGSRVEDVYLCPVGAPDDDGDSLCNAAEARYGTDPQNPDTDGDRLSDALELFGQDNVDLAYYGADPLRRDIFVEIDYYPEMYSPVFGTTVTFRPAQAELDRVEEAFARAPVENPDGSTGISLHLIVDEEIPQEDVIESLNWAAGDMQQFKDRFLERGRDGIFRYALYAYGDSEGAAGRASWPGDKFAVYVLRQTATALMHELGHNLGLGHGGQDAVNRKPHYLSIMNYRYSSLRVDGDVGVLDYSRVSIAGFNESALLESEAYAPLAPTTETDLSRYGVKICSSWASGNASANLDFDRDGSIDSGTVSADLDCDGDLDIWGPSQNDWLALDYSGGGRIGDAHLGGQLQAASMHVREVVGCDLQP